MPKGPVYGLSAAEASVFRNLTVRENLDIALEQTDLSPEQRRDRRQQLIEDFHLTAFMNRLGFQLSGGERRRCEVARALASGANGPLYLLLDEPFAGVDPLAVADLQELIEGLRSRGMGILITDHNVRETLATADRAYILNDGAVLAAGRSEEVAAIPSCVTPGEGFQRFWVVSNESPGCGWICWTAGCSRNFWVLFFFIALFTLLLLTGGVMFELVRQMVDKNLPITIAVQVLLFSIPRWLAFSVPVER